MQLEKRKITKSIHDHIRIRIVKSVYELFLVICAIEGAGDACWGGDLGEYNTTGGDGGRINVTI